MFIPVISPLNPTQLSYNIEDIERVLQKLPAGLVYRDMIRLLSDATSATPYTSNMGDIRVQQALVTTKIWLAGYIQGMREARKASKGGRHE
mgnify:CR=1 FL=1